MADEIFMNILAQGRPIRISRPDYVESMKHYAARKDRMNVRRSYPTADLPGNYVAQLIVNDGHSNSVPSIVTKSTVNTIPIWLGADFGGGRSARL
jgi:hypothetical protein